MPEVKARLRAYGGVAAIMSAYAMLAVVWGMIFQVFLGHMLPRLRDILRHAPLADTPSCDGIQCDFSVFWPAGLLARQGLAAFTALAVVAHAWRDARFSTEQRLALTVTGGILVTPYLFIVDLVAYEIALALLAERRGWRINPLDAFFWLWPMLSPAIYIWKGWLLTPLVMAVLLMHLWVPAALRIRR